MEYSPLSGHLPKTAWVLGQRDIIGALSTPQQIELDGFCVVPAQVPSR